MSVVLLDVNVLLALGLAQHEFHEMAVDWFDAEPARVWASCPFTEAAFVRIASNLRRTPGAATVEQAVGLLGAMKIASKHRFWPDDFSLTDHPAFAKLGGHQQITDAYLVALAIRHRAKLASFDRALTTLAREVFEDGDRILPIPANS